jgi:hypothetical protein|tara:strand:- start:6512 stop:6694 length:183 start_codon:yes stop_codon:yes gene_type:complete
MKTLFLTLTNVTFGQVVGFSAPGGSNYEMDTIPGPKLEDFMVHNDGKNQLLSRQIVKFQK